MQRSFVDVVFVGGRREAMLHSTTLMSHLEGSCELAPLTPALRLGCDHRVAQWREKPDSRSRLNGAVPLGKMQCGLGRLGKQKV